MTHDKTPPPRDEADDEHAVTAETRSADRRKWLAASLGLHLALVATLVGFLGGDADRPVTADAIVVDLVALASIAQEPEEDEARPEDDGSEAGGPEVPPPPPPEPPATSAAAPPAPLQSPEPPPAASSAEAVRRPVPAPPPPEARPAEPATEEAVPGSAILDTTAVGTSGKPTDAVSGAEARRPTADYARALLTRLQRAIDYPGSARRRGAEGIVRMEVSLGPDGHLANVRVVEGSGHDDLDAAALALVRRVAPFPPVPPTLVTAGRFAFVVPIQYRLE